jgi:hypothetical protein
VDTKGKRSKQAGGTPALPGVLQARFSRSVDLVRFQGRVGPSVKLCRQGRAPESFSAGPARRLPVPVRSDVPGACLFVPAAYSALCDASQAPPNASVDVHKVFLGLSNLSLDGLIGGLDTRCGSSSLHNGSLKRRKDAFPLYNGSMNRGKASFPYSMAARAGGKRLSPCSMSRRMHTSRRWIEGK